MLSPDQGAVSPVMSSAPVETLIGEDELDTKLLREMAEEAERYVRSFRWCVEIHERFFGDGYGGIVALFLFRVTIRDVQTPEWVWIVVGDVPSVYLEFDGFPSPRAALLRYIEGVEEWLGASPEQRESGDLIPIEVPPGPELIEALAGRMGTLRSLVLPHLRDS
jgi:hypothetical protein